jgi:hypothetical protein
MRVPLALTLLLTALAAPAFAAGDVAATLASGGRLEVMGDAAANDLQIEKNSITGEFVVLGRNGTTINGGAEFRAEGVKTLRIAMGEGNDLVALGGFGLKKGLRVDLGAGDDRLTTLRNTIKRRATILAGPGNDTLLLEGGTEFRRGVRINTDEGDDLVRLADSVVSGRLRLLTGDGDDRVELHRNGFTELASLVIRTGNGDDWVEAIGCTFQSHVKMQTNDGQDVVYVATSRFRKLAAFKTGKMDDEIELERSTFDAALRVNGGGGLNAVFFISINGAGAAGGGSGDGDKFYWRFVIVHILP